MINGTQQCYIIEGNIGAGKSTLVNLIQQKLGIDVVLEPHERWQHISGTDENILDLFYKNAPRWAYTFQTYTFITRVMAQYEHSTRTGTTLQVLERSVFSDRYCFAYNAYQAGVMSRLEWQLYQEWFDWFIPRFVPRPTGFIYLQVDPTICYQRLRKRARTEEATVAIDYLQQLHDKHEQWLIQKELVVDGLRTVPVLVLQANQDFVTDSERQTIFLQKIAQFMDISYPRVLQKELSSVVSLEKAF